MSQRKRVVHAGSYTAVDDKGNTHTIDIFQTITDLTFLDGGTTSAAGLSSHKMAANGNHVNVNSDGTLEEVATGRILRRA